MVKLRPRVKHVMTFEERLAQEARKLRDAANKEPPGSLSREVFLKRARQTETAAQLNAWLQSTGLQPPK